MALSLFEPVRPLLSALRAQESPAVHAAQLLDLLFLLLSQPGGGDLLDDKGAFYIVAEACTLALVSTVL